MNPNWQPFEEWRRRWKDSNKAGFIPIGLTWSGEHGFWLTMHYLLLSGQGPRCSEVSARSTEEINEMRTTGSVDLSKVEWKLAVERVDLIAILIELLESFSDLDQLFVKQYVSLQELILLDNDQLEWAQLAARIDVDDVILESFWRSEMTDEFGK